MKIYRGAERSEGEREETVNLRRPKEKKGRRCWRPRPCCSRPGVTPEQPGLSSLWEALAPRAQAGRAHRRFPEPQRPFSPAWETQARRHPRLARPTGTSALPAKGNRHKAAAHTMAGLGTRRRLQPRPPMELLALTSGQRGSVIDRHPDLLHPALGQFQRHLRCCIRRPATPGGKTPSWGRRAAADPPGTKDRKGASACTRLGAPLRCFGKCALCGVSEDRRSGDTSQIELGSAWTCGCCTADYPALFRSSGMLQRSDSHAPNTRRCHLLLSCSVGMPHALPGLLRSDR